jgi:tRNA pseudouridine55 synthase
MAITIYKKVGETPLQALERVRIEQGISANVPMTYAGRLDPMAEGVLIVLVGEECKQKEHFLGLNKVYEVEVIFGVATDTYDVLGIVGAPTIAGANSCDNTGVDVVPGGNMHFSYSSMPSLQKYVGKFTQEYPAFSSKTVAGKQLHTYAREGVMPDEMPTKEVEIFSIETLSSSEMLGDEIAKIAIEKVQKVAGDFRQSEIIAGWRRFASQNGHTIHTILKIRVTCSSGTYMRSLAHRIGRDFGTSAIAFSIKRVAVGDFRI